MRESEAEIGNSGYVRGQRQNSWRNQKKQRLTVEIS